MALACSAALPTRGSRMVVRKGRGMCSARLAPCTEKAGAREGLWELGELRHEHAAGWW